MTRDPLDDLGLHDQAPQDPGLAQLFSDLAGPPVDSELAGQQAALSMFRAVRAAQAAQAVQAGAASAAQTRVLGPAARQPTRRPVKSPRRPVSAARRPAGSSRGRPAPAKAGNPAGKSRVGGRLVALALVLAFAGSFAAAGYAAVLPAPLQRVAYQILGFAGVPDSPNRQPRVTHSPPVTSRTVNHSPAASPSPSLPVSTSPSPRPSHHKSQKTEHKSHSPSPHPSSPGRSTGPVQIAIAAAQQEITAGQSLQVTATLTSHGKVAAGIKVSLLELAAIGPGQKGGPGTPAGRGWQIAATSVTDAQGQATFAVSDLTTNALFRVTGPGGATSSRLAVVVAPPITATLESGPSPKADLLVASSPLAQRGDPVELEADVHGQWQPVRLRRLHKDGQAIFNLPLRKIGVTYRVVLPATRAHAESVSPPVSAPPRPRHAKQFPA